MPTTTRTPWGATRSGRRGLALWGPALLIGFAVAGALGALTRFVTPASSPELLGLVVGATALPLGTALGWVLLVDRTSLRGVVDRPEDSVESQWLDRAATGALFDGLAMIGLAAGALAITRVTLPTDLTLIGVWVLIVLDVAVRYLALRRRG
jgi:Co/Zn/Cd efflux system component